ncbi:MAG: LamG domain-containing protein [Candidatus Nanoarchaeia archaeon]|nr:LamG domain-containing protein [Candidatus Nanoarchaeia archaeon]MDD5358465.1 LamG domain-containing protein [Candidatus Nanoarchaeia archaeon]MDD5588979.1 LamG domain-containing protein [Candidatus Nanoarchaeia archaeon]
MDIKKRGFAVGAIIFVSIILSSNFILAEWTEDLNEDLVAYYKMDSITSGIIIDSVNGFNGVLNNSPTLDSGGKIGNGIKFNGINQFAEIPHNPGFNIQNITISVWVRLNSTPTLTPYDAATVISKDRDDGRSWAINSGLNISSNWSAYINNGAPTLVAKGGELTLNNWTHIIMTKNSTALYIYINGILVGQSSASPAIAETTVPIQIGATAFSVMRRFLNGTIDEIGIWDRSLTSSEISQLYNNGNGITYTTDFSIPPNQSEFWTLNGTKLYPSNLNYFVGIGTSNPTTALEVIGNILASNSISLGNNSLRLGTQDAYGRYQIWNFLPNSVLRLGSLGSDGDPQTVSSEGIVVYGKNAQGDTMSSPDFGYARVKPDRIGLYTSKDDIADYYFRVDPTSLYLKNNSFTKMFEVIRETGLVNAKAGYSVDSQAGITDNTGFWMCKDSNCSTTCQADIKGGIIVGCN